MYRVGGRVWCQRKYSVLEWDFGMLRDFFDLARGGDHSIREQTPFGFGQYLHMLMPNT